MLATVGALLWVELGLGVWETPVLREAKVGLLVSDDDRARAGSIAVWINR
jgi:hypothetical protein